MAWYNFNKKEKIVIPEAESSYTEYSAFSTPFGKIGAGDLAAPYIRSYGSERFVRFGHDNLYPQLINQMYFKSPLHGAIINFKASAVLGGGFDLVSLDQSGEQKVKEYTFVKKNNFKKMMRQANKDLIMHGRGCFIIDPTNKDVKITRVGPEKVRNNWNKTLYTVSDDWSRSINMIDYPPYNPTIKVPSMFVYEIDGDAGQDYYPLPQYISASNWFFVDGEMSYLQKANILNSIFASFILTFGKKPKSDVEVAQIKNTVDALKGAQNGGKIAVFAADIPEELPNLIPVPTSDNPKLFLETMEAIQLNIAFAHSMDPLLMGVRVSGKLGSGAELPMVYQIFEKLQVMPLREMLTDIGDELLAIAGVDSKMIINNYQIIDEQIVDKTDENKNNII